MQYVVFFQEDAAQKVGLVGGKNAALAQMIQHLSSKNIKVPLGFAITAEAYRYFLEYNNLVGRIDYLLQELDRTHDLLILKKNGHEIRTMIEGGQMPATMQQEILQAYRQLSATYNQNALDVAVRSSATAEDLPEASFAGQQETFLNITGNDALLEACKKSMASLFTDRAIIYRQEKGFDHLKVALSVGVQKMVRSDLASAGVLFTLETETGFRDIIMIDSSFGLGQAVVQGIINPDEFRVHKPMLKKGFEPIIQKSLGNKLIKLMYGLDSAAPIIEVPVSNKEILQFSLSDEQILELARTAMIIEDYYSHLNNRWTAMDIEWAYDGIDKKLYIVQARPETVHVPKKKYGVVEQYYFDKNVSQKNLQEHTVCTGQSVGNKIVHGIARVVTHVGDMTAFNSGDILVTTMTDPDWVPIMKKAAAIITDKGGRTSHAAIVSRELGISAVIGTEIATRVIKNGQSITIDCSQGSTGFVYDGIFASRTEEIKIQENDACAKRLMLNIADPDQAIAHSFLPTSGVGLARTEFIITHRVKIHPMAAAKPNLIVDETIKKKIDRITSAYSDWKIFFVDTLAQSIGVIAAAFYPRPVIVRFSDFKSNEYRGLLGGVYFEPEEENPMLGLRGASRYYNDLYAPAFQLECAAIKKVRNQMGFFNVHTMIPFVRTIQEARKVIELMKNNGLKRHEDELKLYMMCEVPSNVVLIEEFSELFDGISIGSNDLTQLTLAVDRDSPLLSDVFDERDAAVKKMLQFAVQGAKKNKISSSICGQAPSDYPELGVYLLQQGMDTLSLNPDAVLSFIRYFNDKS